MSRSAGTGSPVWFRCAKARVRRFHSRDGVELTGRTRGYRPARHAMIGSRSVFTAYEYRCKDPNCGHVGWSNHVDLARMAEDTEALAKRGMGM